MTARARRPQRKFMPRGELSNQFDDHEQRIRALEVPYEGEPMKPYRFVADGADKLLIQAGESLYRGHYVSNAHTEFVYVHLYNKASAPIDANVPKVTIGVPFESGANQEYEDGVEEFDLGLAVAVSLDPDDSSVAVPANLIVVTIYYS